ARRRARSRGAARLVRDGAAQAGVSRGPLAACAPASIFVLGLIPGATRAAVARVIAAPSGPVVLLDAGGRGDDTTPDLLGQFALAGSAYAAARFGLSQPRVGLLSVGTEAPAGGDVLRRSGAVFLAGLNSGPDIPFIGLVTADAVALGGTADVIVADGFTGSVVAAALEGAAAVGGPALTPDSVVLGADGVMVQAGPGRDAIGAAVALAATLAAGELVEATRSSMGGLVARRRSRAGLAT
ncbi:MAG: phosphate starvation-inducible protein PhoH, partial [Frankia sp.]